MKSWRVAAKGQPSRGQDGTCPRGTPQLPTLPSSPPDARPRIFSRSRTRASSHSAWAGGAWQGPGEGWSFWQVTQSRRSLISDLPRGHQAGRSAPALDSLEGRLSLPGFWCGRSGGSPRPSDSRPKLKHQKTGRELCGRSPVSCLRTPGTCLRTS